ncbi:MAG: hypothetical protein HQL25_00095 [Candidatus Omnitrophica bacterium]|nr:hypothetical protein [Candidatus Omnitrophota bacterium]
MAKQKRFPNWLIILLVVLMGLVIVKDFLIKSAVEVGSKVVVGVPVKIQSLSLGIFSQKIRIKGFQVFNPQGFPAGIMVDMPDIAVDYDLPALIKGKIHLRLLVLNMKEMIVVKDKAGELNVNALKVSAKKKEEKKEVKQTKETKPLAMQIDLMKLTVRKVIYKDYTSGKPEPAINVVDVGIQDKEFKDIKSAQELAAVVLQATFSSAALKGVGLYGAVTVLGTAFLPVGIAAAVLMDNTASQVFNKSHDEVWNKVLGFISKDGQSVVADKVAGTITAVRNKYKVMVWVKKNKNGIEVKVEAKKSFLPNKQEAERILYDISELIK